jgi:tetratricopeptide (TPR) repeat protein
MRAAEDPALARNAAITRPSAARSRPRRGSDREVQAGDRARPAHSAARTALGELLLKIRRDDEAITVLRAAVDKNPAYSLAWYDLAFALRVRGQHAPPSTLRALHQAEAGDPDPYYGLGRALQHLGRAADARRAFETYLSMEKRPSERRWVESARSAAQDAARQRSSAGDDSLPAAVERERRALPGLLSTDSVPPCATAICRPM